MFFLDPPAGSTAVWILTDDVPAATYEVEVMGSVEALPLTNVVGMIPGRRDDEIVLFGGYYDCMGIIDPVDGDSIANGANAGSEVGGAPPASAACRRPPDVPSRAVYTVQ